MKKKYRIWAYRVFAILLGGVIVLGLAAPALAAPEDGEASSASVWTSVSELDGAYTALTRDDARSKIGGELGSVLISLNDELDGTPKEKEVMSNYGIALVCADWIASNAGERSSGKKETIYDGLEATNDISAYSEQLDAIENIRDSISSNANLLTTVNNSKTGEVATSSVLSALEKGTALVDHDLAGYDGYYKALVAILKDYVDANVTGIMNSYYGSDDSISNHFTTEICDAAIDDGNYDDEMLTDIRNNSKTLAKYIDVGNTIVSMYSVYAGMTLLDNEGETDEEADTWKAFRYVRNTHIEGDNLSSWTIAIMRVLRSEGNDDTRPDNGQSNTISGIDTTKGTLRALSNAVHSGGNIVFENPSDDPNLTAAGYYVLGAGVVYNPFVSYAGNSSYLSVLCDFMKSASIKDELVAAVQTAINIKKPLYVTDASKNAWAELSSLESVEVAKYRTAFLKDLLDTDNATTSVFAVIKGSMEPSAIDGSTFDYVRTGTGVSANSSVVEVGEGENATSGVIAGDIGGSMMKTPGTEELVASNAQMSKPVLVSSTPNKTKTTSLVSKIGAATHLIICNAAKDCKDNQHIKSATTEMLFLNGLGDIVLSDNTIVLPAIANPALYAYDDVSSAVSDVQDAVNSAVQEAYGTQDAMLDPNYSLEASNDATSIAPIDAGTSTGYYPYTTALLNHYPQTRIAGNGNAQIVNPNEEGKEVFSYQNSLIETTEIKKAGSDNTLDVRDITTSQSIVIASETFCVSSSLDEKVNLMPYVQLQVNMLRGVAALFAGGYAAPRYLQTFRGGNNTATGLSYFPLNEPDTDVMTTYLAQATPLVTSAVRYITDRDSSDVLTSSGRFRIESYIVDFLGEGLQGTQYSETLIKNNQLSYDELVADQYGRFTIFVKDIVSGVLNTVGHIDGVLSLKDGYSNGFFNLMVGFLQDFYLFITIILMIFVAVKFLRGNYSMLYVIMIGVFVFSAFEVYVVWMPTAVPAAYNMVVNDVVEDTVWSTVAVSAEKYDETYRDSNRKDALTGNARAYTTTITLYKMTFSEMRSVATRLGVDYKDIKKGNIVWLDIDAGIFVQGDQIKMSVDSLLANNAIRGLYKSQWDLIDAGADDEEIAEAEVQTIITNPYLLKLQEPYVSLESYYTPFCQIERAFIANLNKFTRVFDVPRNVYNYGQQLSKDAFLFNAFTASGIFLAPGDSDVLAENIKADLMANENTFTVGEVVALCEALYEPQEDWLNLRSVFAQPSPAMQQSLWGVMLQRRGYYDANWRITETGRQWIPDLIAYMNTQTKQFIIKNQSQLNFMSDENAIKMVSLFATTAFTHYVSEFGYWLYPNYLNSSDIELVDVLYGAMTTLKDRNTALDGDIVNTVVLNLGLVGALLILFIALTAVTFVFIMTYLVPVLYAMFGIVLVYKLLNSEQDIGLVKGYVKVTVVTIFLYITFSFGMRLVKMGGYNWYGYVACLIIIILCLYFLSFVIMSVLSNPLEMGNDVLAKNMFGALDRLTGHRLSRMTGNRVYVNARNTYGAGFGAHVPFMRRSPVDTRWSSMVPRRGQHYGRWDDFDDDYRWSGRSRLFDRFDRYGSGRYGNGYGNGYRNGYRTTGFRTTSPMRMFRSVRDSMQRRARETSAQNTNDTQY